MWGKASFVEFLDGAEAGANANEDRFKGIVQGIKKSIVGKGPHTRLG
jgi:hypothetical protein